MCTCSLICFGRVFSLSRFSLSGGKWRDRGRWGVAMRTGQDHGTIFASSQERGVFQDLVMFLPPAIELLLTGKAS